ncbi:glycerol-3-phosphate dehydrogenase [NAD(+)], chloroplastic-like isoform X1 [Triticum dicoccoides]|uniref:glycerol-3-phosphate dehydrogenase [NAD(+)], chloroplastic-like isoform X1 n=1 Tax=Triticum dicoccoides TaxID=85692 RepID=UPI00189083A1|nr:glycerol-3-phosphate dehydrogenase [NAD(+)], chloroplastic-like isoform X1 [Triticum dicoccoides]XP_044362214.1 glycerol-3-phosphate dehydrogenase [NAD(+)], chloroplastic-like isoform X1 [Triticum aestivum]
MAAAAAFLPPAPIFRPRTTTARHRASPICAAASDVPPPDAETDEGEAPRSGRKDRRRVVRIAWEKLVRWSRSWRSRNRSDVLETTRKVVVLGGGSFGTAMAAQVAAKKPDLEVAMLLRDDLVCRSINHRHVNSKYLSEYSLPENIVATTSASEALAGADFCFHAVPVQFSSSFLGSISTYVDPKLPFISLSKGLELNTLRTMSQIIPLALGNPRQPFIVLSGPSFAVELMEKLPTAMVVASKDKKLASAVQQLLASSNLRISTSSDVTGVEIAGALKNVLAIAAGIVEGMHLGNNCMAALVAQGCSEIRWLATKMGAKPTTLSGLSGSGDIMLTCFVNLSRNRNVGLRLGSGEKLDEILDSMNQVAEGVSTAGAVIALAQKYNVKLPVLTAVARIIDNELTPKRAVMELMNLPQCHSGCPSSIRRWQGASGFQMTPRGVTWGPMCIFWDPI